MKAADNIEQILDDYTESLITENEISKEDTEMVSTLTHALYTLRAIETEQRELLKANEELPTVHG